MVQNDGGNPNKRAVAHRKEKVGHLIILKIQLKLKKKKKHIFMILLYIVRAIYISFLNTRHCLNPKYMDIGFAPRLYKT